MDMRAYLDRLKTIQNQPVKLAELHLELATKYGDLAQQYDDFIVEITNVKRTLMAEHKTVAKAEQVYELTKEGIWEKRIRIQMKSLEKLLSAIKRRLETYDREASLTG